MNNIDPDKYRKYLISKQNKEDNKLKKYLRGLLVRVVIVIILFLSLAIACKSNDNLKNKIHKYLYTEDISFTKIKKIYNKYLGGIIPLKKEVNTEKVFSEKLKYNNISIYHDGIKLEVSDNYLVPALKEGMVLFIGDKDNYGKTIIIEDLNGIYYWYGNISTTSLKLYDYVEEGSFIGEADKTLYMVFSKDDKYLNYEDYIK
ncbi:MAG: M23 family metallopeptidase [Bacilli bacterium]|nr:M23 family metallopeptidase [Bacilli bacterium]